MNRGQITRLILATAGACVLAYTALVTSIYYTSRTITAVPSDAIVVLGASHFNGTPSPVFQARLDRANRLYQSGYASHIILTGGVGDDQVISEAQAGANYLTRQAVPEEALLREDTGRTTWQSLQQVGRIIQDNNLKSIIVVSDGFHLLRGKKMAHDLGLQSTFTPATESPIRPNSITEFKFILRESILFPLYMILRV